MYQAVTNDITISVDASYQESASRPDAGHFVFAYHITIHNQSEFACKLLRRHWYIIDSKGTHREVEGEGVIGQQPVLLPEEKHEYVSGCDLPTEVGKMYGTYTMERQMDGKMFEVTIPEFVLEVPYLMN